MFLLGEERRRERPGSKLIDLSLGNPDLEPPEAVLKALIEVASEVLPGAHRYMDNAGYPEVRAFIGRSLSHTEGVLLGENNVFLTCGAAGGIQILMRVLLDPGDEVVLFAPYFSEYVPYSVNMGAKPVTVPTDDAHLPHPHALEAALTPSTRLVILNSPNNPSGVVYPRATCEALFEVLRRHRERTGRVVHVLSDEPYANLIFKPSDYVPLLPLYDALWVVRSHSKDLGLAGERIGYLAWGKALEGASTLGALRNAARSMGFVNAPALMQRLLPKVFDARVDTGVYAERVRAFCDILAAGGVSCVRPGGTFFVFPKSPVLDDRAFSQALLEKGVLVVPGSGFGKPGYVRCSLSRPLEEVKEAANIYVLAYKAMQKEADKLF
jgi:aspartate aminotransferase